eukprot:gene2700-3544_t
MTPPPHPNLDIAVRPLHSDDNPYVEDFASSLAETGSVSVTAFTWDHTQLKTGSVIVFHWPN